MERDPVIGCILGTAAGDALGLPYEGLSPARIGKLVKGSWHHRLLFGHGLVSDDTEHTCFMAQALLDSPDDPDKFEKRLSWSLRWWLLGLPAGVGLATLKSIFKLWIGFPPEKSGVFSAGNGPAMRSALLGVVFGDSPERLKEFVRRSTRVTHSDPKAYFGALAVAVAAHHSTSAKQTSGDAFLKSLKKFLEEEPAEEFLELIEKASLSAMKGDSVSTFAASIGCSKGISGFTYHTVPCVIQTWLRHPTNFRSAVEDILSAGGDTDTTGAILGSIVGAGVGKAGIPGEWLDGIIEWPRSIRWMEELGNKLVRLLDGDTTVGTQSLFVPGVLIRNAIFLMIVLAHGLRRLAPPY
jgi:ADP-ribosylglycohydrolase